MKNKYHVVTMVTICCLISGCVMDRINYQLSVLNKSNKTVSILYSNHTDTTENNVVYYIENVISPDSSKAVIKNGNENVWHEYIEEGKSKKLYLYVFDVDSLKKYNGIYSMAEIVNQHKYLKLLPFSEGDLNRLHWRIAYNN